MEEFQSPSEFRINNPDFPGVGHYFKYLGFDNVNRLTDHIIIYYYGCILKDGGNPSFYKWFFALTIPEIKSILTLMSLSK
jgi:hypothetical protein